MPRSSPDADTPLTRRPGPLRQLRRFVLRALGRVMLAVAGLVLILSVVNPPTTITIAREATAPHPWVRLRDVAPVVARSVVAAEDAGFCAHWGFDMREIRKVIAQGSARGASTLSQQTVKNVFLWQGRSWPRKAMETVLTPVVELFWTKRRILEVYLNVAEFGPGVFGIDAAARHHFGRAPADLTAAQAARLAAILPAPKDRRPRDSRRARAIADGAATIARDGRDACFRASAPG